jgi:purine-binding chemotaxis protein CheW
LKEKVVKLGANSDEIPSGLSLEEEGVRMVAFHLAACEIGVEIGQVREILRVGDITWMPKAPFFLEGVLNLRGRVIPVLDLKKLFNMPLLDRTGESRILVVETKGQTLGLLVDKVLEVRKIPRSGLSPGKEPVLNIGPEFMAGILESEGRFLLVLNLERLLLLDDKRAAEERETEPPGEGKTIGH